MITIITPAIIIGRHRMISKVLNCSTALAPPHPLILRMCKWVRQRRRSIGGKELNGQTEKNLFKPF